MNIGTRIKILREQLGLTLDDLAKYANTTKQTIFKYENGIITNIPMNKIEAIAKVLKTTPGYLVGWENKPTFDIFSLKNVFPLSKPIKLPILGEIRAGEPLYTNQGYSDEWDYEDEIYNDGNHYFLRVKGNSMSPTIPEGALAVIRAQNYAERGDIVACCFNDDCATLKRYYPQPDGSVLLRAENTESESYVIPSEQFENGSANIIGIVREVKIKLYR